MPKASSVFCADVGGHLHLLLGRRLEAFDERARLQAAENFAELVGDFGELGQQVFLLLHGVVHLLLRRGFRRLGRVVVGLLLVVGRGVQRRWSAGAACRRRAAWARRSGRRAWRRAAC